MNCWGTSMNSLILSDMFVEWRRKLGREGEVLVKVKDVARKLSTCYSGPRDDLKPSASGDLTSVAVFRGQRYVYSSREFENGCLLGEFQRSV